MAYYLLAWKESTVEAGKPSYGKLSGLHTYTREVRSNIEEYFHIILVSLRGLQQRDCHLIDRQPQF
jgi:hypothetical protein